MLLNICKAVAQNAKAIKNAGNAFAYLQNPLQKCEAGLFSKLCLIFTSVNKRLDRSGIFSGMLLSKQINFIDWHKRMLAPAKQGTRHLPA